MRTRSARGTAFVIAILVLAALATAACSGGGAQATSGSASTDKAMEAFKDSLLFRESTKPEVHLPGDWLVNGPENQSSTVAVRYDDGGGSLKGTIVELYMTADEDYYVVKSFAVSYKGKTKLFALDSGGIALDGPERADLRKAISTAEYELNGWDY